MRLKKEFELVELMDENLLVPVGDERDKFLGVVALNDVSARLLREMKDKDQTIEKLADIMFQEYDVDYEVLRQDMCEHIRELNEMGVLAGWEENA